MGRRNLDHVDDAGAADLARVEKALESRFPTRMVPDLDRIVDLLDLLGSPQRAYPSIHITGTNGKTTTARMIDALLRGFGVRTGRYTSPHLESVVERIALDGRPIDAERFAAAYDDIAPYVDLVDARHPDRMTFFELLTAMAFATFADAPVDVGVIEVGLGGRWDATNVIDAPVAVVMPIGLDHVGLLGDTVEAIAAEKAGIVHAGALLVTGPQPEGAGRVLANHAAGVGATLLQAGRDFGVRGRSVAIGGQLLDLEGLGGRYDEVFLPLHGAHQAGNAVCALAAVEAFFGVRDGGRGPLDPDVVRAAFAAVTSPGRLEVVRRAPTVMLDGAHNPAGAAALAAALDEAFTFDRLVAVVALLDDKDAVGLLAELGPVVSKVVVTTNSSPRALPAQALATVARSVLGDDRVEVAERLDDAIERAIAIAEEPDDGGGIAGGGVLITGSIVTVGDARQLLVAGSRP
ncbi:MAG: dihydrofolate synthase / folylpolyglutamate synthase [Frankiaceae bacterium]|jgi:dihydrofolate synthase/folylpolyglutamate synthase|nr:dihydrofolate synthase / folylpolyglutamate synthase [Frankiaceae bacterium]